MFQPPPLFNQGQKTTISLLFLFEDGIKYLRIVQETIY